MSTTAFETMRTLGQCALSGTVYGVDPYMDSRFIPIYKVAITKALQKLYTEFNLKEDLLSFPSSMAADIPLPVHAVIKPLQAKYANGADISINNLNDPYSAMLKQHDILQLTVPSNQTTGYLSYQAYHASLDLLEGYAAPFFATNQERKEFLFAIKPNEGGGKVVSTDMNWLYVCKLLLVASTQYANASSVDDGATYNVTLVTGEQYTFSCTYDNGGMAYVDAAEDPDIKLFVYTSDTEPVILVYSPRKTAYVDVPILLPVYMHNAFFALVSFYVLNTLTTSTDWSGAVGEMYREYKRNVELVKNSMLLRTQEESTNLVRRDLGWL